MKNKKGIELNITTIVVVILAVLVLVILALSFTVGLDKMWQSIVAFFGGTSGLEAKNVIAQCNLNPKDDWFFCCKRFDTREFGSVTCAELRTKVSGADFTEQAKAVECTVQCSST